MKVTFKTYGMMCEHCENRVRKAVCALDKVVSCNADHSSGDVTVEYEEGFDIENAKNAILDAGYDVLS